MIQSGRYRLVLGIWHKLCSGPVHEEPEWLPATPKYFYFLKTGERKGLPFSQCRLCINWRKLKSPGSHHGYVSVDRVRPFYIEAVNRVGMQEVKNRTGLSFGHLNGVISQKLQYVKKAKLRKLMLELVSMQRKNEYSVTPSSRWRTERRNNRGQITCGSCGTPAQNMTAHCDACYDRHFNWFKKGKITQQEWEERRKRADISREK